MAKSKTPKKTPSKVIYPTPVEHVKHRDKRVNIPTEELRDFVAEAENSPKKMLYPRDPSLDPQLVWKGKDEQDAKPLEVPVVPIYIQEKIHPQAIIEDLRTQSRKENPDDQIGLFSDFNGIKFEEMIEFYQHEQNWSNRAILGDSLLVMTSLAEKEGLKGKVQSIYFDPPYGIKFGSNWQVSTRKREVKDGKVEDASRQPEQVKAFRDTWQLGIHSYLAYLRDRFVVSRDLLTESGSFFIQISDENVHLVRSLLDEVFGSENFIAQIGYRTSAPLGSKYIPGIFDYVIWYSKNAESVKFRRHFVPKTSKGDEYYNVVELPDGSYRRLSYEEQEGTTSIPDEARVFANITLVAAGPNPSCVFPIDFDGRTWMPTSNRGWKTTETGIARVKMANRLFATADVLRYKFYLNDFPLKEITNLWENLGGASDKIYVVQTNPEIMQRCLLMTTDPGDLVLDPTCGSGTTAYVAEQWGRRWITIDTSRVALALARTRLMAARFSYYLLADSSEGVKKESEVTGKIPPETTVKPANDIKRGFLYKRVPHVTLKSIANNEEIDVIHAKWQEKLEPIRAELNKLLDKKWEEWEVPRPIVIARSEATRQSDTTNREIASLEDARNDDEKWMITMKGEEVEIKGKAKKLLAEWWKLRRERQKEIDDSIASRADTELLYDQPYEDSKRIRVTGPFTVESLSPHRVLSTADENLDGLVSGREAMQQQDFVSMILDNLRKAGVQNTIRKERLKFERLDSFAGIYINATGEYLEEGKTKRCAIHIGPEHGTVGPNEVKEAAKEAVQGVGFDLLIVCGFAFDPHVSEETKRYGKLTVLTARMNPDLAMGNELLKKTGAGNLFMVFGEPDMDVKKQKDGLPAGQAGKVVVTIKGLDVYDPTTGEIRSSSTDDIACWFIDTNYNGESFFVRHAYFTGADEPYEKLKRALRAEIDEAAWSALYSTKSRSFDSPKTGKIAVKIINHYGDEVLKVFEVK